MPKSTPGDILAKKASDSFWLSPESSGRGLMTLDEHPEGAEARADRRLIVHLEGHEIGRVVDADRDGRTGPHRRLQRQGEEQGHKLVLVLFERVVDRRLEFELVAIRFGDREIAELLQGIDIGLGQRRQLLRRQDLVRSADPLRDEGRIHIVERPGGADPGDLAVRPEDHLLPCGDEDVGMGFGGPRSRGQAGRRRRVSPRATGATARRERSVTMAFRHDVCLDRSRRTATTLLPQCRSSSAVLRQRCPAPRPASASRKLRHARCPFTLGLTVADARRAAMPAVPSGCARPDRHPVEAEPRRHRACRGHTRRSDTCGRDGTTRESIMFSQKSAPALRHHALAFEAEGRACRGGVGGRDKPGHDEVSKKQFAFLCGAA